MSRATATAMMPSVEDESRMRATPVIETQFSGATTAKNSPDNDRTDERPDFGLPEKSPEKADFGNPLVSSWRQLLVCHASKPPLLR